MNQQRVGPISIMLAVLLLALLIVSQAAIAHCRVDRATLSTVALSADRFGNLRTLHIAVDGELLMADGFNGASANDSTNVKSASKTLLAAVVGAAIERGVLDGVDERVVDALPDAVPPDADPLLEDLTVEHLLSMQAGLERTYGENYGSWVASRDWVRAALSRPMEGRPGGRMRYSTGNSHLLSAILQRRTGEPSYVLANRWFDPAGISVDHWMDDPQGIAFGGNQVSMRPEALLALGELYRRDGLTPDGERLLPPGWVEASWELRGRSRWTNDGYGYGWFIRDFAGIEGYYGWGFGGQMLYVLPELGATVVMTSAPNQPSGRTGYRDELHGFMEELISGGAVDCQGVF